MNRPYAFATPCCVPALVAVLATSPVASMSAPRGAPAVLTLDVSRPSGALYPGDVVLLTVRAARPLTVVECRAFRRLVPLWPAADAHEWQGLVGIALDTAPGRYEVVIQGTAASSGSSDVAIAAASGRLALTVRAKRFDTRNLQVAEQFVNPPAAEGERIAAEARRMADIFAQARPQRLWSGAFVRPVPGQANSSFGRLTTLNDRRGTRHQGADFRAGAGTPVHAPNAGEVVLASDLYFSGNTVILDHGFGLFSLLAHLSRIGVSAGDRVARGDILGDSGATGRVTGPHLHWAVKLGDVSVDPLSLMQAVAPSESAPVVPPPGH